MFPRVGQRLPRLSLLIPNSFNFQPAQRPLRLNKLQLVAKLQMVALLNMQTLLLSVPAQHQTGKIPVALAVAVFIIVSLRAGRILRGQA